MFISYSVSIIDETVSGNRVVFQRLYRDSSDFFFWFFSSLAFSVVFVFFGRAYESRGSSRNHARVESVGADAAHGALL